MKKKKGLLIGLHALSKVVILIVAVLIIFFAGKKVYDYSYKLMAKTPAKDIVVKTVDIKVPKGTLSKEIAKILHDNGLIKNTYYFLLYSKLSGKENKFQYGDYTLNTGMTDEEIANILTTQGAKKETIKFTIPEGYTVVQIAKKLAKENICKESEFLDAVTNVCYDYKFIDEVPDRNLKLQGYLFPSTYEIYTDATAKDIVSIMLKQFDKIFKDKYYERAKVLGYEIDEIITIASIIEREVRVDSERELVSGVIYNRLKKPMKLQMCSTVMYALDKPRERLLYSDLEIESPYNTYMNPGLPIGPISNPGQRSIEAALYPTESNYLYFSLKNAETGEHEFNKSLDAHNKVKGKLQKEF
ncbi:endolytic transglycosylase MltG [Vallitalea sp.]|jgi:UPF0755 protein|uniref:endolytic transglycosylase MltG n=1 Tax=Vallitalea sp. TaxID=1882829 RepID=UPI0025F55920|nr:endolytic transglycosylase MltG [Vallitalea sp.]MCT4687139.1 endolytic transglycosylase MltG [Vallitalea sp.]